MIDLTELKAEDRKIVKEWTTQAGLPVLVVQGVVRADPEAVAQGWVAADSCSTYQVLYLKVPEPNPLYPQGYEDPAAKEDPPEYLILDCLGTPEFSGPLAALDPKFGSYPC